MFDVKTPNVKKLLRFLEEVKYVPGINKMYIVSSIF